MFLFCSYFKLFTYGELIYFDELMTESGVLRSRSQSICAFKQRSGSRVVSLNNEKFAQIQSLLFCEVSSKNQVVNAATGRLARFRQASRQLFVMKQQRIQTLEE